MPPRRILHREPVLFEELPLAFRVWRLTRQMVADERVEVIHTIGEPASSLLYLARRGLPPLVTTVHGDYMHELSLRKPARRWARVRRQCAWLFRQTCLGSDAITAPSRWMADRVEEQVPGVTVRVVPNGIEPWPDRVAHGANERSGDERAPVVCTVNNLDTEYRREGFLLFVGAARRIRESLPTARFQLIGSGNSRNMAWATEQSGDVGVELLGYLGDPRPVIAAADLYLHASLLDSFSLSVLEAMSVSTPVVATSVGGIPELLDGGTCGVLVPPRPGGLARATLSVLRGEAATGEVVARALERVWGAYGRNAMAERFEALYRAACGARKGAPNAVRW